MSKKLDLEIKVGIFVTLGVALLMASILALGGNSSLFSRRASFASHFDRVDGLITGAKIVLGGIQVGTITDIAFDMEKRDIKVTYSVDNNATQWIRQDSTAEIATQGVLGDKYISLNAGSLDKPLIQPGSDIPIRPSEGLSKLLTRSDQLMVTLTSLASSLDRVVKSFETDRRSDTFFGGMAATAKNAASATEKLNRELDDIQIKKITRNLGSILEKINNGTGTIGALVNDPGLYDDVKKLVGEANRNRIVRNLLRQSIKESEKEEKKQ